MGGRRDGDGGSGCKTTRLRRADCGGPVISAGVRIQAAAAYPNLTYGILLVFPVEVEALRRVSKKGCGFTASW